MIYCIMGISGTGKTTVARHLSEKINMDLVISYTSRPIREGEVEDVDYHYVDNKYFDDNKNDFIEIREYTVFDGSKWRYGYKREDFNNKDCLVVMEPDGFELFSNFFSIDKLFPIIINSHKEDILERVKQRGDNPKEFERRMLDDTSKYDAFVLMYDVHNVFNMYDIDYVSTQIEKLIKKEK